jgi:hypothetical protein
MGQFEFGEEIYNFAQKMLAEEKLNVDQNIKLFMVFSNLKKGEKPWIEKLLKGIVETVHEADVEQLTGVLQNLKEAKSLPEEMNGRIEQRVEVLLPQFNLNQLLNVTSYFGFEHDN